MRPDPAQRTFLSLLGVTAAIASTLCGFSSAFFHGEARIDASHADERLLGVALIALLAMVVIAGAARCAGEVCRRLVVTSRLVRAFAALDAAPPPHLLAAAGRHGVASRLRWLESGEPIALTVGLIRPHVVVSRGLLATLDGPELDAVLAHEAYHVRRRDPLRAVVAHGAAAGFFLVPLVRRLSRQYVERAELAADRRAVEAVGCRPVAGALANLLASPRTGLAVASAMGGPTALEARVLQLEHGAPPSDASPGWIGSAAVFAVMVTLLDGILLLLGLHTRLVPTAVDAGVHMAMFLSIWAVAVLVPPRLVRLTWRVRRHISTT